MNEHLLHEDVQQFIYDHLQNDIYNLSLQGVPFEKVSAGEIADQIRGILTVQQKAPGFFKKGLLFPSKTSLEQMSSDVTAKYKASILPKMKSLIDCTGGFGIDTFYLSEKARTTHYCEQNKELVRIAEHNFQLHNKKIHVHEGNGLEILQKIGKIDLVYLDPSRRTAGKKKIISLEQSSPNILQHWQMILSHAREVLLKLSPMLDISYLLEQLTGIFEIHIISVKNDVKEIIVRASQARQEDVKITIADFDGQHWFQHVVNEQDSALVNIQEIPEQAFIYEPLSVVFKAEYQDDLAVKYNLNKIARHSHLYLSTEKISEHFFKSYQYSRVLSFHVKKLKRLLPETHVNVITRNFPLSPQQVVKKLGKKEGGQTFLLCTQTENSKLCFIAEKSDKNA